MLQFKTNINEIGIDESGRGPLFGRVYVGAVIWEKDLNFELIKDSKKLTCKKRAIALEWIKKNIKSWTVTYATEEEIDKYNILEATKMAMIRAIKNLEIDNEFNNIIIDGTNWENKIKNYKIESVVKGDDKYYSIAAASIIAKEYHDDYIKKLCKENPELENKYNLLSNKGYGTKNHINAIKNYGYSVYHRKTFLKNITNICCKCNKEFNIIKLSLFLNNSCNISCDYCGTCNKCKFICSSCDAAIPISP